MLYENEIMERYFLFVVNKKIKDTENMLVDFLR